MILVTVGTQDKEFTRLIKAVEDLVIKNVIKEDVVVQAGYTKYFSDEIKIFDYIGMDEFEKLINDCNILITHGGIGSIITGIKKDKKVLAMARLSKYHEHVNDHQKQIIENFSKEGYIIEIDENNLEEVITNIERFIPKKYDNVNDKMINIVTDFIENI